MQRTKTNTKKEAMDTKDGRMPAEERIAWILDKAISDPMRGVVALIGPTQQGKTYMVQNYLRDRGYELVMLNPQHDLPEDIGGWPMREGNQLSFTQPSAIPPHIFKQFNNPEKKWALYIDELDKARDDTLSALLTLLNPDERRLRSTVIPKHVPIIVSLNERHTLPEPLVARLLFVAFPQEDMTLDNRKDLAPVSRFANEICPSPKVSFPARPDTPGSLHKLVRWMADREFWIDTGIRWTVVRGLFSEKGASIVMSRLAEAPPKHGKEWAQVCTPPEMLEHIIEILSASNYQEGVEVLTELANRANNDKTGEMEKALAIFLNCQKALHAVHRPDEIEEGKRALKVDIMKGNEEPEGKKELERSKKEKK